MPDERSEGCCVCNGSGRYPILDQTGRELYAITCPECLGEPQEGVRPAHSSDPSITDTSIIGPEWAGTKSLNRIADALERIAKTLDHRNRWRD